MKPKKIFILLCLFGVCADYAQTYNFHVYAEDQGLAHTYVYHITQAPNGPLYLSTGEGLSVYDGRGFTTYTNKDLAANFVSVHFVDSRKIPWIGHSQKGVTYMKGTKFVSVTNDLLSGYKVTQFAEDKYKNIWISTSGGGLFRVDSNFLLKAVNCPEASNINSMLFNSDGYLIAGTTNGLFLLNTTTNTAKVLCDVPEFRHKNIKQVCPVQKSKRLFWVSVEGEGVYKIKREGDCFKIVMHIQSQLMAAQSENISCIYSDRGGNLWVSLFGEGLRKIIFNTYNEDYSVYKIDKANGLKNVHIQSIFEDFEGNMWFGTFGGGLIEKPIEKFSFYSLKDGLENVDVRKVVRDRNGNLWIGNKNGFSFFNPESYTYIQYNKKNGFLDDEVNALEMDDDGILWIGTQSHGVYLFDPEAGKFENFSAKYKSSQLSINYIIKCKDEMLIASEEGVCNFALRSKDIKFYTTNDGLLHNNVLHLFFDKKKRLWVSSHGSPPYYLSNGKDTALKDITDLFSFNVNAITEDQNGNIWIATEGDGVFRYDGKHITNYRMTEGLCSNYCYGIEVDKNNSVWVAHKNGLSEKKALKKDFNPITKTEGLLFIENNQNAIYKDRNGDLWFGTTEGIVHYNSEIGRISNAEPKVSILGLKISGNPFILSEPVEVPYGIHSVHIEFLAISLTNPEKIKYKSRLLGVDSTWKITPSATPFMDYPTLSNGKYKFQLMACNSEGLWTQKPVEIEFTIREPIWKKIWFYVLLVAGVVSITYLIIVWRTANLKRSQMLLQTKVKQKTFLLQREKEEVEKIKVELEIKNKDITDSINYAKRIQDSLLPPDELLSDLFDENHFIFYKPKDIVSGDFYWAAKVETGGEKSQKLSLAAVADCTGHGVPGAFLSIVANSFLKQSLTEKFVTNTGEVLDYLNKNITGTLNQSSKIRNRIRDGMDLAIIAIDYKAHKLYYSGANNSLYIFRKTDAEPKLFILKPTKQAIGSVSEKILNYQSQIFDLLAGDTIYMFTDGYPDQFGGDYDKKLNYKRFKEILSTASEMPVSLQRAYLEECFERWKGRAPQTDDVCVMAIKI